MAITVRELIQMEEMADYTILSGGKGLDREVLTVSVMDAPDVFQWLRGGELVLTSGYTMKDHPETIAELIENINKAGAAALFIKMGRFIEELPREAIEVSERLQFPIVFMPYNHPFTDVINPVLSRIVWNQSQVIRHSVSIHQAFVDIALHDKGIREVVTALQKLLKRNTVFCDTMFDRIFTPADLQLQEDFMERCADEYTCIPVESEKVPYGFFVLLEKESQINEYDRITLEHASTYVKLMMQKKISNMQVEKRYRDQFVEDLIFSNIKSDAEIIQRSKLFGWEFKGDYRVFIVGIDHFKNQFENLMYSESGEQLNRMAGSVFDAARGVFKSGGLSVIYTFFSDHAVFIMNGIGAGMKPQISSVAANIHRAIKEKFGCTVTVASGSLEKNKMDISRSYQEAKRALKIAEVVYGVDSTVFYEDLGLYKILDQISSAPGVAAYCRDSLDELIRYDREKKGELIRTLIALIENDWNLKQTAKVCFFHYNTVKYRYHKIQEFLGIDLSATSAKLNLELAVRMYQISES